MFTFDFFIDLFCCFRFNSIHKITDKPLLGLQKLELLMVHGNDIQTLPDGVFRDLVSLQVLSPWNMLIT